MKPTFRVLLFCLPLAVLFGPPALVLWLSGELTAPERVVARQATRDRLVLHGVAYTNSATYVKMHALARRAPQVLVLGSSRVMQFRAGFFLPGATFYNAGGTVARIMHFRAVLERLPRERQPQLLLIATDAYFFHAGFDKVERDFFNVAWLEEQMNARPSGSEVFHANWWTVWRDIAAGKIAWTQLFSLRGLDDHIGLNAVCNDQGFRNDGSYLYGARMRDITDPRHRDFGFRSTLEQVEKGRGRFVHGSELSAPALRELDALLDTCRTRGIEVIGFLPPYPHAVWARMAAMPEKFGYLAKLPPTLRPRFEDRGFEFYDFSDFAALGAADSEAIDGFHGSEKTYLQLTAAMLEQGSRLNRYASLPEVRRTLAGAQSHWNLVPDVFFK